MLINADSKKELLMLMEENIHNGKNDCYEYMGYSFYRDGESKYKVFDEDGNDRGSHYIDDLDEKILKKLEPKNKQRKISRVNNKGRKKKKGDIILPEFMSWLHGKKCIVHGCNRRDIEAHHIIGRQPYRYDNLCVPLCPEHHRGSTYSWHEGNVKEFRQDYPIETLTDISIELIEEWIDENMVSNPNIDFIKKITNSIKNRKKSIKDAIKEAILEEDKG